MAKKSPQERLAELEERKRKLQKRAQRERQKVKREEQKRDARRKIILGGALLNAARRDPDAANLVRRFVAGLNERDAEVFRDYELPTSTEHPPRGTDG